MSPSQATHATDEAWRDWGRRDPYFAVITDPKFRQSQISDEARQEFFASGDRHVEYLRHMTRRLLAQPTFAPARALDFGCGVGRIAIPLARLAGEVVGVDISEDMLGEARRNAERQGVANVRFELSDDTLSRVDGEFDFVHSFIVLQHIDLPRGRAFFQQLVDRVAPNGLGAIQVTYAKAVHADRWGQPPAIAQLAAEPARVGFLRRLAQRAGWVQPNPADGDADPQMQMNCYSLNELLFIVQQARAHVAHLEFTDHGGELGVFIYFRKPAAPPR